MGDLQYMAHFSFLSGNSSFWVFSRLRSNFGKIEKILPYGIDLILLIEKISFALE